MRRVADVHWARIDFPETGRAESVALYRTDCGLSSELIDGDAREERRNRLVPCGPAILGVDMVEVNENGCVHRSHPRVPLIRDPSASREAVRNESPGQTNAVPLLFRKWVVARSLWQHPLGRKRPSQRMMRESNTIPYARAPSIQGSLSSLFPFCCVGPIRRGGFRLASVTREAARKSADFHRRVGRSPVTRSAPACPAVHGTRRPVPYLA